MIQQFLDSSLAAFFALTNAFLLLIVIFLYRAERLRGGYQRKRCVYDC